jgi:hypothetical protein
MSESPRWGGERVPKSRIPERLFIILIFFYPVEQVQLASRYLPRPLGPSSEFFSFTVKKQNGTG